MLWVKDTVRSERGGISGAMAGGFESTLLFKKPIVRRGSEQIGIYMNGEGGNGWWRRGIGSLPSGWLSPITWQPCGEQVVELPRES
jgi:hypothetical protein